MDAQRTTTDSTTAASTKPSKDEGFSIPGISTFSGAFQSIKETLGFEDQKSAESSNTDARSTTDQTKKEGTFSLPTLATFDNAFQSIKDTLGFDEVKQDTDSSSSPKLNSSNVTSGSNQSDADTSSEKKEGGFSIPLFDSTLQSIKGTLGLDDTKDASTQSETAKKDSSFSLPSLPSFDGTLQSIKGTLGLEDTNQDSTKAQASTSSTGESTSEEPNSINSSTKKDGGFSLPGLSKLDGAMQSLRETFGIDEKAKTETSPSQSDKKEGGFGLPGMPSFDTTFKSIRDTLGIDNLTPDFLGKPQQSPTVAATTDSNAAQPTTTDSVANF